MPRKKSSKSEGVRVFAQRLGETTTDEEYPKTVLALMLKVALGSDSAANTMTHFNRNRNATIPLQNVHPLAKTFGDSFNAWFLPDPQIPFDEMILNLVSTPGRRGQLNQISSLERKTLLKSLTKDWTKQVRRHLSPHQMGDTIPNLAGIRGQWRRKRVKNARKLRVVRGSTIFSLSVVWQFTT